MATKPETISKEAENVKDKTSTSIYKKDSKTVQKRKIEEGHSNAAETIELILQENQEYQEQISELQEENEELEQRLRELEKRNQELQENLEENQ